MMPPMRSVSCFVSVLAVIGLATGSACAPADNTSSGPAPAERCSKDSLTTLTKGTITFGTDQPAYPPWFIDDDPANGKSRRVSVEPHGYRKVYLGECTTGGLEAQTHSGRVIATLDSRWCPGQDWIITAEGEFVLDSRP